MPVKPSVAAAKAVAANPTASNRAIAAEIGIDHKTVAKARRSTGINSPVEKRIGLDGKSRKMPVPTFTSKDADEEDSVTIDMVEATISSRRSRRQNLHRATPCDTGA
jgi:hypothetical protein